MENISSLRIEIVEAVRNKIQFHQYELTEDEIGEHSEIHACPAFLQRCWIKTHPKFRGSMFSGMKEMGLIGGFMPSDIGLKVLVIYTERPVSPDGVFDFGLVPLDQVRFFKEPK